MSNDLSLFLSGPPSTYNTHENRGLQAIQGTRVTWIMIFTLALFKLYKSLMIDIFLHCFRLFLYILQDLNHIR